MQIAISLFFALGVLFSSIAGSLPASNSQAQYSPEELLAIKPDLREEVAAKLPTGLTEYEINISIPDTNANASPVATGWQRVTFTNTLGEPLTELPFRLYANGAAVDRNPLELNSVVVNDADLSWEYSEFDSLAMIALESELAPGEQVSLEMEFTLTIPVDDPSHYGILNSATDTGTTTLAHWYPVLAGRDPATGWMLKPTSKFGDPIFTDMGLYDVSITAPSNQQIITSGVEVSRDDDSVEQTVTYNAKPSRDFVIVLSDTLQSTSTEVEGTTITSWAQPQHSAAGESVLEWTANSLEVFNPLLGEYPWLELHAIEALVFSAAAVELPQMFIVSSSYYPDRNLGEPLSYFEFTVAHEVVHMWFYSLVGNNQYDDAFIDEGLTNYLSGDVYFREVYGQTEGDAAFMMFIFRPFQRMIEANADVIVDFPTDNFPTSNAYVSAVYTKAPVGFQVIHTEMGDEPFFAGLSNYVDEFGFRVATPADLEQTLQAETDVDIRALWSHWFERREGNLDINGAQPQWIG